MSVVTLRAKPCIVRPSREAHADRRDLARHDGGSDGRRRPTHRDTRRAGRRSAGRAREGVDQQALDTAHVRRRAEPVVDVEDRIADELPGPVVGDVAAALDRHEVGADRGRVAPGCVEVGALAVREHVRVFEQQQMLLDVRGRTAPAGRASASRYGTRPSQRTRSGARRRHSSADQSLVSRICLDPLEEAGRVGAVEGPVVPAHRQVADRMDGDRLAAVGGRRRRPACGRSRRWR